MRFKSSKLPLISSKWISVVLYSRPFHASNGTMYTIMDQVKFVEDSLTWSILEYFVKNIQPIQTICESKRSSFFIQVQMAPIKARAVNMVIVNKNYTFIYKLFFKLSSPGINFHFKILVFSMNNVEIQC